MDLSIFFAGTAGSVPTARRGLPATLIRRGADKVLIDCGEGTQRQLIRSVGLPDLTEIFLTHLHTDHTIDYPSFLFSGAYTALKNKAPVTVYGPGPARGLPPSRVGNADPATIDPAHPTPGLADMTKALEQAYAYTNNIFIRDMGTDDVQKLFIVNEIAVPPEASYQNRSPRTNPFPVMSDDNVTVTATLVSHYDVFPAFGFRFDLKKSDVSVTFSGDTTKSDNLVTLAKDTDILVHESQFSLDDAWWHNKFPANYLTSSHTSAEQVGEVAAAANAKHVVLSHYDPPDLPDSRWTDAIGKHFSGEITIARDGQVIAL
jgi:ribonuclease BN (tRNA processing enzyme)